MLFRRNIERRCAYCTRASKIDEDHMVCRRQGVVMAGDACLGFRYDPLKRIPSRPKPKSTKKFKPEDFQL